MSNSNIFQSEHVCPWWLGGMLDNFVRRWLHKPEEMLADLVEPGMVTADIGCGPGYFTEGMARMVGDDGRVIAVDLQPKMLARTGQRLRRANLSSRVQLHPCEADRLNLPHPLDFALAFWMVHEIPDQKRFLAEIYAALRPGAKLLLAEPKLHVSQSAFRQTVATAQAVGYQTAPAPPVRVSYAALLVRNQ